MKYVYRLFACQLFSALQTQFIDILGFYLYLTEVCGETRLYFFALART